MTKEDLNPYRGSTAATVKVSMGGGLMSPGYNEKAKTIHLKYLLCEKLGKPYEYASQMNIIFEGKRLEDDILLQPLNLSDETCVHLIIK